MSNGNNDLPPMAEKRPIRRKRVLLGGVIVYDEGRGSFKCSIQDITPDVYPTGARIKAGDVPPLPKNVYLINISERTAHPAEVKWITRTGAGLRLSQSIALDRLDDPKLNYLKIIFSTHAPR